MEELQIITLGEVMVNLIIVVGSIVSILLFAHHRNRFN